MDPVRRLCRVWKLAAFALPVCCIAIAISVAQSTSQETRNRSASNGDPAAHASAALAVKIRVCEGPTRQPARAAEPAGCPPIRLCYVHGPKEIIVELAERIA